jgi:hypothetical protein
VNRTLLVERVTKTKIITEPGKQEFFEGCMQGGCWPGYFIDPDNSAFGIFGDR